MHAVQLDPNLDDDEVSDHPVSPLENPVLAPSTVALPPSTPLTTPIAPKAPPLVEPTIALVPVPWTPDNDQNYCYSCASELLPSDTASAFSALLLSSSTKTRRHHCRCCGHIFCHPCSSYRCLVPPERVVLRGDNPNSGVPYRDPRLGPDSTLSNARIQRGIQCREPQRVCLQCFTLLAPMQPSLRQKYSNAMRFNSIEGSSSGGGTDSGSSGGPWWTRFVNSPLAFTLGHEVRKAAITLENLLPLPKSTPSRRPSGTRSLYGAADDDDEGEGNWSLNRLGVPSPSSVGCSPRSANLRELDGVRIPARLLSQARGLAVLTIVRAGLWVGGEFGTGLVVARLPDGSWSAPSAIGLVGVSVGALAGAQVSDHVFLLMSDAAVELLGTNTGSVNLGVDIAVSVGPVGRSVEADVGITGGLDHQRQHTAKAPIYSYSLSKGLYAGVSFDGKVIATRHDVNEKFYGMQVEPYDLLSGEVPRPPAAQPLYDALRRCSVYVKRECGDDAVAPPPPTPPPPPSASPPTTPVRVASRGSSASSSAAAGGAYDNILPPTASISYRAHPAAAAPESSPGAHQAPTLEAEAPAPANNHHPPFSSPFSQVVQARLNPFESAGKILATPTTPNPPNKMNPFVDRSYAQSYAQDDLADLVDEPAAAAAQRSGGTGGAGAAQQQRPQRDGDWPF